MRYPRAVAVRATAFFAAYLGTHLVLRGQGLALFSPESILWLPTGVAVAGLWLLGPRYWPVIALGTLLQRLWSRYEFPWFTFGVVASTLEALAACWVLRRLGFRQDFRRLQDGLALLAAAVVGPAVGATVGRIAVLIQGNFHGWLSWWRMNALGLLVVVPLVLTWAGGPHRRPGPRTMAEVAALATMALGLAWLLTGVGPSGDSGLVLSYLVLPLAFYAAVRFGVRGAATAGTAVVLLALLGAAHGLGPFFISGTATTPPQVRILALQSVIAIAVAAPILLGATIAERESALARAAVERGLHDDLLASINRNVNEGLFRVVPGHGLAYANRACARILGYAAPGGMIGRAWAGWFADRARAKQVQARVLDQGRLDGEEITLLRQDGTPVPVLLSCTLLRGSDGRVEACDGALSDITARKQLEEQLRTTQKMEALGKLAGGVAHDFNNLLTVIGGHAEMLRASLPDDSEGRDHAREIALATTRAARLTQQLLAYSRRQMLQPEVLDLREAIDSMGSMLQRLIGEDVRLVIQHAPAPILVRVDRGQIEQVVLNLVVNARDAMPGGGTLTLETGDPPPAARDAPADLPAEPLACLTVRDTGTGMTPEVVRHAFDPFFTTKEPGKGTGLGLSMVEGIVRQSGGAAWIESAPGAGTAVRVCLPRVAREQRAAEPPGAPAVGAGRGTVLVAEDEPDVRALISKILEQAGYTVLTAADGVEALAVAEPADRRIDLLVTDAVMPRMGGRELIARLAERRPGLPVVLISGYVTASDPAVPADPAIAHLAKPFTVSGLLGRVRASLAARGTGA